MKKIIQLTPLQKDALREIASIGISHAATALSRMIKKKVLINVPEVNIHSLEKLPNLLAPENQLIVGIYFKVLGKASGRVLLSFKKESAHLLSDILMKKKTGETKILSEIEQSALKELGAISTAVCLNALTELLSMTLIPSVPHFRYDYAKSIVGELFDEVKAESRFVVVVDSEFKESDSKVLGKFFIFPDEHAFEVIWKTLNLKQSNKESSGTKAE